MTSEELCILASWFLSPMSTEQEFSFTGVESKKISSYPGRDVLKSVLKVSNA